MLTLDGKCICKQYTNQIIYIRTMSHKTMKLLFDIRFILSLVDTHNFFLMKINVIRKRRVQIKICLN